ncbi:MAG TPA: DUF4139 domain-containing protein [Bacteroidales bacterium]|nr:DUF4139 domain-containing protein [Bacteroidales bacterium]
MKHLTILIIAVISMMQLYGQSPVTSKANINEVTVYLYGAEVKAKSTVNLTKGRGIFEIHNISSQAINNSVQISNNQNIEILSVSVEDYSDDAEKIFPEIKRMNDSVKIISNKITAYNNEKSSFEAEKEHLVKNLYIGGSDVGVNITDMKAASTYYRERTLAIKQEMTRIDDLINKENEKLSDIYLRKNKILVENNMNFKKIIIEYETESAITANFEISYISGKCGWAPTYDLKAKEIGEPVLMKYKAKVFNNTGIAWTSVKMKLSTGDPLQGASAPTISTWDLNYNDPAPGKGIYDNAIKQEYRQFESEQYAVMDEQINYNTVAVSEISVEFEIAKNYNIPADGKPYTIDVTEYTLTADFSYYAIPKFESNVYLIGKIIGWESLNLIDGDMNVYFGETYLGVSKLNTSSLNDTLELSFGRDKQISIKRNRIEEFSKKSLLGNSRKESFQYDIIVKNNRKVDITISIVDQVPISRESEIEVTVGELSGGEHNTVTGKVAWNTTLKPGESKKYSFGYSVKYPKEQTVNTKQYRSMASPMF